MKKIFATLLLLTPLMVSADDFGMNVPEWKDFAPKTFVDVQEPKLFKNENINMNFNLILYFLFLPSLCEASKLKRL